MPMDDGQVGDKVDGQAVGRRAAAAHDAAADAADAAADAADTTDPAVNERLADAIEHEWGFRMRRLPAEVVERVGIVVVVLGALEALLVFSNSVRPLGLWAAFVRQSTRCRERVMHTAVGRLLRLDDDAGRLNPYSLWRGWAVPTLLAGSTYVGVALLTLRVELYHWKPALLAHYLEAVRASRLGRAVPVPPAWLDRLFLAYEGAHRRYLRRRLQPGRTHRALQDARELAAVLRVVAANIALSAAVLLAYWALLLCCTGIESHDIARLPPSFVPPLQGLVWYLIDDALYFYPHWIAHLGGGGGGGSAASAGSRSRPRSRSRPGPGSRLKRSGTGVGTGAGAGPVWFRLLPAAVRQPLARRLNQAHKLHHRSRANLGIAAWYCSPLEQVFFNLGPVLAGPFLTQVLADRAGPRAAAVWGTHLVTLYVWLMAGAAMSVLGHTGYRSSLNDPGKHDLHHERALDPHTAVNFGTMGLLDWLHGTASAIPAADAAAWRRQRTRQAALHAASRRSGIPLTQAQQEIVQQPRHGPAWTGRTI